MDIYCTGRNYAEHARELNNPVPTGDPVVFLKAAAALRPLSGGPLAFPGETFHHEAELVLRIGKAVALGAKGGWEAVDQVALGIDLTRREVQSKLKAQGLPWTVAKSFAGSALLGDFVPTSRFKDLDAISFTLDVNGERRQTGNTSDMIFNVPTLITYLASLHSLAPGDLVYTGTPSGVGPVRKGDKLSLTFMDLAINFSGVL